jgi:hypothetical protein
MDDEVDEVDDVDDVDSVYDDMADDMVSETGPTRATSRGHCRVAAHRPPPQHASQCLADIARHSKACHRSQQLARHVKGCHESQQPKIQHILDDVASNICLILPHCGVDAVSSNEHICLHRPGAPRGAVA